MINLKTQSDKSNYIIYIDINILNIRQRMTKFLSVYQESSIKIHNQYIYIDIKLFTRSKGRNQI